MQSIRRLTPELFPSAGELLAQAFFSNPAHIYLCRDPRTRAARLEWLLGRNLRAQPDLRNSFCLAEGSVVEAMGFWTKSTAPDIGFRARLRAGILVAPFRIGLAPLRRAFEVTREVERHLEHALGDRPFWYLNNMAVRERLRGSGIGSRLLREQLRSVTQQDPSLAIALSTQRAENVAFYERLGFRVVWDERIGAGPGAFRNWTMAHDPTA